MSYDNIRIEKVYTPQVSLSLRHLRHLTHQKTTRAHLLKVLMHTNVSLKDLTLRFRAKTAILFQSFSKLPIQQLFFLNLYPVLLSSV